MQPCPWVRKLYFITAGRNAGSLFIDFLFGTWDVSLCCTSASDGSQTGQTIGTLVEGMFVVDFDIPAEVNFTPLAASLIAAPGENIVQKSRGCSEVVLKRNAGHKTQRARLSVLQQRRGELVVSCMVHSVVGIRESGR